MTSDVLNTKISNLPDYLKQIIPKFGIDKERRKTLCFREILEVFKKDRIPTDTKPVGDYRICVENIGPSNREFLVHVSSSMTVDGFLGGSILTCSATKELHCLDEKRQEFVEIHGSKIEKNLYLGYGKTGLEKTGHFVKTEQFPSSSKMSFDILPEDDSKLISDGCNILLARYLALIDFNGSFSLNVLTIDGNIVQSFYECLRSKPMEIEGVIVDVCKIKQKLVDNGLIIHESETLITSEGKILYLDWIHTSYMMKLNPFLKPTVEFGPVLFPLQSVWREDLELNSKYIDRKVDEIANQEEYLSLHPEVRYLIMDYVQTLLCRKPNDVFTFTINYFKTFTEDQISETPDEKSSSSSQTNDSSEMGLTYCLFVDSKVSPELCSKIKNET